MGQNAVTIAIGPAEASIALELTWHARTSDIPESLWRECFAPPYEGLFWFRALEAGTRPGQFTFRFGELVRDGVPIGIVPAFYFDVPLELVIPPRLAYFVLPIAKGPFKGLAYQRTFFIGNVAGEEGHVGLLPGHALDDFAAFIHAGARAKADTVSAQLLVWKDFPDGDRGALDALAGATHSFRIVSYPGSSIPLVAPGYEAFLATRRPEQRHNVKTALQRGKAMLALQAQVVEHPAEYQLAEIFALFRQTCERATTRFEELTPEFFAAMARCDEATFIVLRDAPSGAMRAFMLMLDLGDRIINQYIGIDHDRDEGTNLYFRLFEAAYDWACTTGAAMLHSGQTSYTAKLDTGHTLIPLSNYCEHRSEIVNAVFRHGAAGIAWDTLDPQLAGYLRAHPEMRPLQ